MKTLLIGIMAALLLAACGKSEQTAQSSKQFVWKEEVRLQDGRILWVDRVSKIAGKRFPEGGGDDFYQSLTFSHPDTGESITWSPPKGAAPVLLAVAGPNVYFVAEAYSVGAYNDIDCPNPPYLVYRFADHQWAPVPMTELPAQFVERNIQRLVLDDEDAVADGVVTAAEFHGRMHDDRHRPESRVISRERVNPIALGCHGDVLEKQGRQSEIDYRR